MKYMLLMHTTPARSAQPWTADEMAASWAHMQAIERDLREAGELVGGAALTGPQAAKIVTSDGASAPVISDGPFAETKEFLAGYWMIDVETEERALEIAARTSAAPGAGGGPSARPIEVRAMMSAPDPEL